MKFPTNPPGKKDKEIVVFGKGYGESILIHLSGHKYILIDNFINNQTGNSIAADYLMSIGLSPNAIIGIVCTHFDDDHCNGISSLIENNMNHKPIVFVPLSHDEKTFEALITLNELDGGCSMTEIIRLLDLHNKKCSLRFAVEAMEMFAERLPFVNGNKVRLYALSPDQNFCVDYVKKILKFRNKQYKLPSPNDLSIVSTLKIDGDNIVLGADMSKKGWKKINQCYRTELDKCSIYKVPHHGSKNSYLLETIESFNQKPIAIITRFNKGSHPLPDDEMIAKYRKNTKLFVVGKRMKPFCKEEVSEFDKTNNVIDDEPGFVRLTKDNSNNWSCEKYGSVDEYD